MIRLWIAYYRIARRCTGRLMAARIAYGFVRMHAKVNSVREALR